VSDDLIVLFLTLSCDPWQPVNDEQRLKLVEEIKTRAKACIGSRNYPEAVRLYSKAIELTSDDNAALAILFANRSMVNLNMGKSADALLDADEAVKLDANYLKGYYRQAMAASALNDFNLAKRALLAGLALKSDDKELQAQLTKVEQKLQAAAAAPAAAPSSSSVPAATNRVKVSHVTTPSVPTSASPVPPVPPAAKPVASAPAKAEEDDEDDLEKLNVRGYKKTADGRTTTFFNHDLDEETKKLIGSIAPKKLDAQGEVITTGATTGSAWNAAGTYEEKIFTPWVTDKLKQEFESIHLNLTADSVPPVIRAGLPDLTNFSLDITGTENTTCHAQITMNRGKKKHVCDYSSTLQWQLALSFSSGRPATKVQGSLSVADVTADREYEIENIIVTKLDENAAQLSALPGDLQNAVNKAIKSGDGILQREILSKLNNFWDEFRSK
jgi:tetratricopeptide (TPR) repeat protein